MEIIETNLKFKSLSSLGTVKRIILHHAEATSCTIEQIHEWHLNNGRSGCGYHFLVRKDGTIYRGRPEKNLGAHTQNYNLGSLGICFEGKFNSETMTEAQLKSGQELITYLCDKYLLNKALDVKRHKDFNSTDCPGTNFPYDKLINSNVVIVKKSYAERLKEECQIQGLKYKPTVKYGANGNITKLIQEILKVNVDGIFGTQTLEAVKTFQKKNNLVVDGVVGEKTWGKLLGE